MASRKDTDRFVLSASGMTNIRTEPLTEDQKRRARTYSKTYANPRPKKGKRNGR